MSYAILILLHTEGQMGLARKVLDGLISRGHDNVHLAVINGSPGPEEVMESLVGQGVDSVMVFPLTIAEGRLTVNIMPKRLGMPDNSCSYTYVNNRNVTIRFMTALGEDPRVLDVFCQRAIEGGAVDDEGVLIVARGSRNSSNGRMAERVASVFGSRGFGNVVTCSMKHGGVSMDEAFDRLVSNGASSVTVVPMFLSGTSPLEYIESRWNPGDKDHERISIRVMDPLGFDPVLVDSIDDRIPDGW